MSGSRHSQSKRRRRDRERDRADDDEAGIVRGSGINYSKVADRHVDDNRFEKHRQASAAPAAVPSSQMTAVMRLMAGMEERTISEKLADSNRPTWEQYKKDNEDKLNLAGVDQKKMDAYRKELDANRDKLLTRGKNHRREGDDEKKSKKKKKRKHSRRDEGHSSDSESSDFSSSDEGKSHKRKKHRKKHGKHARKKSSRSSKHKRKKDKERRREGSESGSDKDYRLSTFFTKGSDDDESR